MTTKKNTSVINRLYGASLAKQLALEINKSEQLAIIITENNYDAWQLAKEVKFFLPEREQRHFSDWETLPYDLISPHQGIISERLETLEKLSDKKPQALFVAITTMMHYLCPQSFLGQYHFSLGVGDTLSITQFKQRLEKSGYRFVNKVIEHGECAFRGSIIDIFPMGIKTPLRIDLFDQEVDSIRTFDIDTQRSIDKINHVSLLPAREFPVDENGITKFRKQWREMFPGNPRQCPIYSDVSDGIFPAGIEYYQPLFFDDSASLFDYLPDDAKLFLVGNVVTSSEHFIDDVKSRYEQRSSDITRPILPVDKLFLSVSDFFARVKQFDRIELHQEARSKHNANTKAAPPLPIDRKLTNPLHAVQDYLNDNQGKRSVIIAESSGRREVLLDLLHGIHIKPALLENWQAFEANDEPLAIIEGPLAEGVELIDENINIIVESQLFGETAVRQRKRQKSFDPDVIIRDLTELHINAPVVHIQHGVGRYRGLTLIKTHNEENEFLLIEYADNAKIYVPVTSLHLISRYTGGAMEHAPLHHLGSDKWQKEKKKAQKQISDVACELLDIHAKREAQKGFVCARPTKEYHNFAALFPFEETQDQINAINDVINDMCQEKPMDRLICGDVGFGKTEVAMRATFLAIANNKQVCMIVPTTLLAEQHYNNFLDRFADFAVNIELLSRFRTKKESDNILTGLQSGRIDMVIGTHKLFQKDIKFKQLGLLIVDEEHRFGVKQKEHIKKIKHNVEILTLTATPIPRTLNMSMAGMRDISLIATPPAKRLAIKTFQQEKSDSLLKEAISREVLRGGQVFYLHNKVETIDHVATELSELLPDIKVEIAHGQMRERQLEKVMSDFYHHKFNVLICTTIIETGIDIPTANTIIIDRADKFGLAQLHQLRGRVGRSHHQAYAYLLTPNPKAMTSDAKKRLDALLSLDDLGAGFTLATHDLEIRGAGQLLGDEQSGNMHTLGFSLYMELLEKAVKTIKRGETIDFNDINNDNVEVNLRLNAIIPETYLNDVHMRLIFYKRIANATSKENLHELQVEMIDRFGLFPDPLKRLFKITELKLKAQALGIKKISCREEDGKLNFVDKPNVSPETIIRLIQLHAAKYKLQGSNQLNFKINKENDRIDEVNNVLIKLAEKSNNHDQHDVA